MRTVSDRIRAASSRQHRGNIFSPWWDNTGTRSSRWPTWAASQTWERYFTRQEKKLCHGDVMVLSWSRGAGSPWNRQRSIWTCQNFQPIEKIRSIREVRSLWSFVAQNFGDRKWSGGFPYKIKCSQLYNKWFPTRVVGTNWIYKGNRYFIFGPQNFWVMILQSDLTSRILRIFSIGW